jgi:hypothetical protein
VKVEVALEDVGVGENHELFENIPLHAQKLNYGTNIYEL